MARPDSIAKLQVRTEKGSCHLSGSIDFRSARIALEEIAPLIGREPQLSIDLGELTSVNSAGLALLVEWRSLAAQHGHTVSFERIPDSLRQLARVCEVEDLVIN